MRNKALLILCACLYSLTVLADNINGYEWTNQYFMYQCPIDGKSEMMGDFVNHCGLINTLGLEVMSKDVVYSTNNRAANIEVKAEAIFWDFAFRCQRYSEILRFVPSEYSVKWTLKGRKNSNTGTVIYTKSVDETYTYADDELTQENHNKDTKMRNTRSRAINYTFSIGVDELLTNAGINQSDMTVYWEVSATIVLKNAVEYVSDALVGGYATHVESHSGTVKSKTTIKGTIAYTTKLRYEAQKFSFAMSDNNAVMALNDGECSVVYDDPRSEVQFNITLGKSNNLPATKLLDDKSTNRHIYFIASDNVGMVFGTPREQKTFPNYFVDYVKKEIKSTAINYYGNVCARYQNLVLNTNGNTLEDPKQVVNNTLEKAGWGKVTVSTDTESDKAQQIVRHLSDFSYGDFELNNSSVVYVGAKAVYAPISNTGDYIFGNFFDDYILSYNSYNPTAKSIICSSDNSKTVEGCEYLKSNNVVSFRVLPSVSFPTLTEAEKTEKKVCRLAHDSLISSTTDYIHLRGKSLKLHNSISSETLYMPEYRWEYRAVFRNGTEGSWQDLGKTDYTLTSDRIPFALGMDDNDMLVSTSIFAQDVVKVQFRQKAVLKSFSSKNYIPNFYHTPNADGTAYYITIFSDDVYSYSTVPDKMSLTNFNWDELPEGVTADKLELNICTPKGASNVSEFYKIAFSMRETPNLKGEEFKQVENVAKYSIKNITPKQGHAININDKTGYLEYYGDTVIYRCNIAVCGNNYFQDMQINPAQIPSITILGNEMQTFNGTKVGDFTVMDAFVAARDSINMPNTLYLTAERGKDVGLSLDNSDGTPGVVFQYRKVVPFIMPELENTDFSGWSWQDLVTYCTEKCGAGCTKTYKNYGINLLIDEAKEYERQDNIALIEKAKNDSINANSWVQIAEIQNVYNVNLVPYDREIEKAVFYVKKYNRFGCESDSVRIEVLYADPITNNAIQLENGKTVTWIASTACNPVIQGSLPTGGFGTPIENSNNQYTIQWMYKVNEYEGWQPLPTMNNVVLSTANKNYNTATKGVYLPVDKICADGNSIQLRRVVVSNKLGSVGASIADSSNIVTLRVLQTISADNFTVPASTCSGSLIRINPKDINFDFYEGVHYELVGATPGVIMDTITYIVVDRRDHEAIISDAVSDFDVEAYCYLHDNGTLVKTNVVTLPIRVLTLDVNFDVYINPTSYNYSSKEIQVNAGERIRLVNKTKVDTELNIEYLGWTLQYQTINNREVATATSTIENPACYLYNNGTSKINLELRASNGCISSKAASISVVGKPSTRRVPVFVDEDGSNEYELGKVLENETTISLYPTITTGTITIATNLDNYDVAVSDLSGRTLSTLTGMSGVNTLQLGGLTDGTYIVRVGDKTFKIVKQ